MKIFLSAYNTFFINLGKVKEMRFQLFGRKEGVLELPETSLRCITKRFRNNPSFKLLSIDNNGICVHIHL